MRNKILIFVALLLLAGGGAVGWWLYTYEPPEHLEDAWVKIPTGTTYPQLVTLLAKEGLITDTVRFKKIAQREGFDTIAVRAGLFNLVRGGRPKTLMERIKLAENTPVKVTFNNLRKKEELAEYVARFLEPDSAALVAMMNDTAYLQKNGFTPDNVMAAFIPNTYNMYWNTSPKEFMERMFREHRRFWNEDRLALARKLALDTKEVYTLASIVEKETNRNEDKPRIAGVYLNRLKAKGWKLQADPTVLFALNDFTIRRINEEQFKTDSPYNTYVYPGLPPGPIAMASIATIDSVLHAEKHDYWFFCAKIDGSGEHHFSKSFKDQKKYAKDWNDMMKGKGF